MNEATYIGIDYGHKKTGLAVGQTISATASPLDTVPTDPKKHLWHTIEQYMAQWHPAGFVLGIPMSDSIKNHPLIPSIVKFAKKLSNKYQKPVFLVDERLSSHEAHSQLKSTLNKRKKGKNIPLDSLAAKIILETWLQNPHNHLKLESLENLL